MTNQERHKFEATILSGKQMKDGQSLFNYEVETIFNSHALRKDIGYTTVSASFMAVKDHPELIRVSTRYWRGENEVNAVYPIQEARDFYARLLKAGFEK